jgi:hypothetical protein
MSKETRKLREALHTPPRIRAACLWGDALENRLDFDAAYWFQYFEDEVMMDHFADALYIRMPDGDVVLSLTGEHAEWGCLELVMELPEAYPGLDSMSRWLAEKGAVGYADLTEEQENEATMALDFIEIYLSRADALAWLRKHRPELYADIKSVYSLPPSTERFFL